MRPLHILFAVAVVVIWGGNFIALKYTLVHFPPFFLNALRFIGTTMLLLPFVPIPDKRQLRALLTIGTLNALHFSLPVVGLFLGLNIASTAITAQLGIPFSCLFGAILLNDRLGPWRSVGMVISFAGMLVVFGAPNVLDHKMGFFAVFTGAFFWGLTNVLLKQLKGLGMFQALAWLSLFTIPPLFVLSFIFEPGAWQTLENIPASALWGLAYSIVASTIVAHSLWYMLLQTYPITYVAPYSLMTPVCGAVLALWTFGEPITWQIAVGGLITLAGVAIIVKRRPKLAENAEPT